MRTPPTSSQDRAPERRGGPAGGAGASRPQAVATARIHAPEEARRCPAEETRGGGSFQEVGDAAGREPGGALSVHAAPVVAEDRAAQPERDEQQPPRALRVRLAAVLAQEAQLPAQVLDEHPTLVRRRV